MSEPTAMQERDFVATLVAELQKNHPDVAHKDVEEALRQAITLHGEKTIEQGYELETGCVIVDKEERSEVSPGAGLLIRDASQFLLRTVGTWRPPQTPSIP